MMKLAVNWNRIRRYFRFSLNRKAILGIILAFSSFSWAQEFEVENMPIKTAGHSVSGGWAISAVGYVADTLEVNHPGFYRFKIRARETNAGKIIPQLLVRVNDCEMGPIFVNETNFYDYKSLCYLQPGIYQFALHLTNDLSENELVLDKINIYSVEFIESDWFFKIAESILNRYPDPWRYSIKSWQIEELMWGIAKVYEQTGELRFANYIRSYLNDHVSNNGDIDEEINGFTPGVLLAWMYWMSNESKYLLASEKVGEYILNDYPRTSEGGFVHLTRLEDQLWVDTLGGLGRFLAWMGFITGDHRYFDEGANQIIVHALHLQDEQTGLFYHAWDEDRSAAWSDPATGCSPIFWARGNGWALRGIVDFLEFLPDSHPSREKILGILGKLAQGIRNFQDSKTGLWHTVMDAVDDTNNYTETASNLLIVYGLQKAIRLNFLPDSFQAVIEKANKSLYQKIYDKGNDATIVTGISGGTDPGDFDNYINIPIGWDEVYSYGNGLFAQEKAEIVAANDQELKILSIYVTDITGSSAVVSWATNQPCDAQVEYGLDLGYGNLSDFDPVLVNYHQIQLSGLEENTTYHFRVISKNASGESIISNDSTFSTIGMPNLSFSDISRTSGIGENNGVDRVGGHATCFADVDMDGLPDLYLTMLFENPMADLFFHNEGNNLFSEQASQRGISDFDGGSHGACFADLDNDGDYDLINGTTYSFQGGPDVNNLFRNDGNGYFEDVTENTDFIKNSWPTRAVIAFDMDNDGDLDIFAVSNYRGSDDPPDEMNEIYRNDGDFHFVSVDTSLLRFIPAAQGASAVDYDNDGDIDLFVANRTGPVNIARNDGTGNFTLVDPAEIGIVHYGRESISFADVNRDGFLDMLLVGDGEGHLAYLYFNNGDSTFSFVQQFEAISGYMGGFADLDNDGDLDLVFSGDEICYLNDGKGYFSPGPQIPIDGANDPRSVSFADIDNDGDLDFAIGCKRSLSLLIRNNLKSGNWLNVKLQSAVGQAGAFGARVYVYNASQPTELLTMQEAQSSQGYLGQNDPVLHFGLGDLNFVNVVVKFLDGKIVEKYNVAANQTIFINPALEPDEIIYPPNRPVLIGEPWKGAELIFACDSARSNLNHQLEYQFQWDDTSKSAWGDSVQAHTYFESGNFVIKARARCKWHPDFISDWSDSLIVHISGLYCNVTIQPDEGGLVEKEPFKEDYLFGDTLTLKAVPDSGYKFVRWSGDISDSLNPVQIKIIHNLNIVAIFELSQEVINAPQIIDGPDTLFLSQEGIFRTGGSNSNMGHAVEYQFAWSDSAFSDWGDSVRVTRFDSVGAYLVRSRARCAQHHSVISPWSVGKILNVLPIKISVAVKPDSSGTVEINPMKENYAYQDTVILTAIPNAEMYFSHWSGDVSEDSSSVRIVLEKNLHVQCWFQKKSEILSPPDTILGERFLFRKQGAEFVAKGAISNLSHLLEYQFDWGDGNFSYWGDSTQTRTYYEDGEYNVRCRVRCSLHPDLISTWSDTFIVKVRGCKIFKEVVPGGSGVIELVPEKEDYDYGEQVKVSALPAPNFKFIHWNSDHDSTSILQLTIYQDTTFVANFKLLSGVILGEDGVPQEFGLSQNYPNPFNMETIISYQIPDHTQIKIVVYNIKGQVVATLENKKVSPGYYFIRWNGVDENGTSLPSGIYWVVLESNKSKLYKKMILLR